MTLPLIRLLPEGNLDIVGDIHGEISSLKSLLKCLGYDANGQHPQGRKVVFVGDFCDRGPDSIAVIYLIEDWINSGNAHAVLGNHEVNLLMGDAKDGSGWYFPEQREKDAERYCYRQVKEDEKVHIETFLNSLPIGLERQDIRIVHASWLPENMEKLRQMGNIDVRRAYQYWQEKRQQAMCEEPWYRQYLAERAYYQTIAHNAKHTPPLLQGVAENDYFRSCFNPLQLALCGTERKVTTPFYSAGRWRFTTRTPWWQDYNAKTPVVMGHYWRRWDERGVLFPEEPNAWLGKHQNIFCVDFSIGKQWLRRQQQAAGLSMVDVRLAALRWPEKTLMFANGHCCETLCAID